MILFHCSWDLSGRIQTFITQRNYFAGFVGFHLWSKDRAELVLWLLESSFWMQLNTSSNFKSPAPLVPIKVSLSFAALSSGTGFSSTFLNVLARWPLHCSLAWCLSWIFCRTGCSSYTSPWQGLTWPMDNTEASSFRPQASCLVLLCTFFPIASSPLQPSEN